MKSNESVPERTQVGVGKVFKDIWTDAQRSPMLPSNKNIGSLRKRVVYLNKDMQKVTKDKKMLIFKE